MSTIWLITGTNRGIGASLIEQLSHRDGHVILAGMRSPEKSQESIDRLNAHCSPNTRVIAFACDYNHTESIAKSIKATLEGLGIDHIDNVVANAGIAKTFKDVSSTTLDEIQEHFQINVQGNVALYHAVRPFLLRSRGSQARFVYISTHASSFGQPMPFPGTAYISSKLPMNYIIRRIDQEEDAINAFALAPGAVNTEMGRLALRSFGFADAEGNIDWSKLPFSSISPEESASKCIERILRATKKDAGGRFLSYEEGQEVEW